MANKKKSVKKKSMFTVLRLGKFIMAIFLIVLGLIYLFLSLDLIPDKVLPVIGYLDDAGVILLLYFLYRRAVKKFGLKD